MGWTAAAIRQRRNRSDPCYRSDFPARFEPRPRALLDPPLGTHGDRARFAAQRLVDDLFSVIVAGYAPRPSVWEKFIKKLAPAVISLCCYSDVVLVICNSMRNLLMHKYVLSAVVVSLIAATCVPFVAVSIIPTYDLVNHILVGRILARLHDPQLRYSDYFVVKNYFQPMALPQLILAAMECVLDPLVAGRLSMVAVTVFLYLAERFYLRQVTGESAPYVALIVLPLALSWHVYLGTLPFVVSWPLFGVLLGVWQKLRSSWKRSLIGGGMIAVLYFCHPLTALVAAFTVTMFALGEALGSGHWRRLFVKDWLPGAVAIALFLAYSQSGKGGDNAMAFFPPLKAAWAFLRYNLASVDNWSIWINLVGLMLLGAAILASWRTWRLEVLLAAAPLWIIGVVSPITIGALWPAGPRLFSFALMVSLGLLRPRPSRQWTMIGAVALVIGLDSAFITAKSLQIDRSSQIALSALDEIALGSKILWIVPEAGTYSRYVHHDAHLLNVYTLYRGGASPYVYAYPYVKSGGLLSYVDERKTFPFAFRFDPLRLREPSAYRGVSAAYDYVLLWGTDAPLQRTLSEEMVVLVTRPPLSIYQGKRRQEPKRQTQTPGQNRQGSDWRHEE